jgi:hypothetical protein
VVKAKRADLEAWETAIRAAVLAAGAEALARLLEGIGSGRRDEPVYCKCGTRMESQGLADKTLVTILGPVAYCRSMFAHATPAMRNWTWWAPADRRVCGE